MNLAEDSIKEKGEGLDQTNKEYEKKINKQEVWTPWKDQTFQIQE